MATGKSGKRKEKKEKVVKPNHTHGELAGALAGEMVGGLVGALAGPPGVIAGMVMGGAAGALAGKVMDQEAERGHIHDDELDDEIGVTGRDLGGGVPKGSSK
jgi:uncharacterized membrane protein